MSRLRVLTMASLMMAVIAVTPTAADDGAPAQSRLILDTNSLYRLHFTWRPELIRLEDGKLQESLLLTEWKNRGKIVAAGPASSTPPPSADWRDVAFDDADWPRARGPMFTRRNRQIAQLSLRGKFAVSDPAKVEGLALSLAYRGGAAVYVNGKEVARKHLPEGDLTPRTPAEDYPPDAYVDPEGYLLRWVGFGDPEKFGQRFALRRRELEVKIPGSLLRRGVNVLAVEIHRAPTARILYSGKPRANDKGYAVWAMLSLEKLKLTASAGSAVTPNVARPAGQQVWRHPVALSLHTTDFGDPNETLQPIVIRGTRNGAFSGQVVLSGDGAIEGVTATVGELAGPGAAAIPASAVQVRFGQLGFSGEGGQERQYKHSGGEEFSYGRGVLRFDGLRDPGSPGPARIEPDQAHDAVLPIWVTVHVPGDAKPGDYRGRLTVGHGGQTTAVPIELHVSGWALPDPQRFVTHIGLIQSPDSLAIRYHVKPWSDEHWALIEGSFKLLAQVGDKVLYLPLLRKTYFGNEQSMVRWIRKSDGGWDHDLSIVERYVATAVKHLGRVPVVCAYCWDVNTGSTYAGGGHEVGKIGMPITILDPKSGRLTEGNGPKWGEPAVRALWKPVFEKLSALLAKHGLADSLMVGIAGDRRPGADAVADLQAVAPNAPWVVSSHGNPSDIHKQPVGYNSVVWGISLAPDPVEARYHGWLGKRRTVGFPRYVFPPAGEYLRDFSPMGVYRIAPEGAITARYGRTGLRGIGRCGADFWPVLKSTRPGRGPTPISGRYPETNAWHGGWLHYSTPHMLAPGPAGPISSARFEMFREGLQEAEARIFIQNALLDQARRASLGKELAERAQALLDFRVRLNRFAAEGRGCVPSWTWYGGAGWQQASGELYDLAAEVAAKLAE